MIGTIIMILLYWLSMFFGGYAFPTVDARAILLMVLLYISGLAIYFYQLATGIYTLPSSLPTSTEIGAIGLFLILYISSSLGGGYMVGKYIEKRNTAKGRKEYGIQTPLRNKADRR